MLINIYPKKIISASQNLKLYSWISKTKTQILILKRFVNWESILRFKRVNLVLYFKTIHPFVKSTTDTKRIVGYGYFPIKWVIVLQKSICYQYIILRWKLPLLLKATVKSWVCLKFPNFLRSTYKITDNRLFCSICTIFQNTS